MIRKLYAKNFATKNFAELLLQFSLAVNATRASSTAIKQKFAQCEFRNTFYYGIRASL